MDASGIRLNDYIGNYYSKELDVTYIFEIDDGVLKSRIEKKESIECTIDDLDQFALGLARFQRTNRVISGFELDSGRVKNLKFEKK